MRADSPGIQNEGISHEVALREKLAIAIICVSTQETFINGVINNFNPCRWDTKQLLDFALGKFGNGEDPCRTSKHSASKLKMQKTPKPGAIVRTVHVFQHVVDSHHI